MDEAEESVLELAREFEPIKNGEIFWINNDN